MAFQKYKLACLTLLSGAFFYSSVDAKSLQDTIAPNSAKDVPTVMAKLDLTEGAQASIAETELRRQTLEYYGPWLTANGYSSNAQELIQSIQDVRVHGLNPEAYELSAILETVKAIAALSSKNTDDDAENSEKTKAIADLRVNFDKQLNAAFTSLAIDLGRGRTKAQKVQRQMFRAAPKVNTQEWLNAISKGQVTIAQALDSLMPHDQAYHRLTTRMRELLAERNLGTQRIVVEESERACKRISRP